MFNFFHTFYRIFLLLLLCLGASVPAENPEVDRRLRDARVEVAVAEGVHQRVKEEYEKMQADPSVSPEEVLAMEAYVNELEEMVLLRTKTLEDLVEMSGTGMTEVDPGITEGIRKFDEAIDQVPDTAGPETEAARLEREFNESLNAFDGMILGYNEKLEAQMDARIARGEAAVGKQQSAVEEAEALLKSMGVETGAGPKEGRPPPGNETAGGPERPEGGQEDVPRREPGTEANEGSHPVAENGSEGTHAGGGGNRAPAVDEDIVARQLREAAEKETDPVLREKLWKEYEAYLDGRS